MTVKVIIAFTLSVTSLLLGCASTPVTHHYYLLESPTSKTDINSDQAIVLHPIDLSDYLKSNNLHVKSNSGEVFYSATDSWAEQPNKMLWRFMEQSLENQTGHPVFASSNHKGLSSCAQIKIRIDELSPTVTGNVNSNGRWFISASEKILQTNKFSFSGNISVDGYLASNKEFVNHLNQLSIQLNEQIRRLGLCQS